MLRVVRARRHRPRPPRVSFDGSHREQLKYGADFSHFIRNIIEAEFIGEFQDIVKIREVIMAFRKRPSVMDCGALRGIVSFKFDYAGDDEVEVRTWTFLVHPLFSEYLRLDHTGQDLALQFTWEYLHTLEALRAANPQL
jgi:hypothetical protein